MSGHSKWHKIKRDKAATDHKKGKVFGQLAREISSAIRKGGADPQANAILRDAIARAKKANMPQANIDRLLTGKDEARLEETTYEGFGPGGAALLITARTDNQNRTVSEVRSILKNHGGTLSSPNSVRWKFTQHHFASDLQSGAGLTDEIIPTYPIKLSPEDKQTLDNLMRELENHPDVVRVITDAAR